MDKAIKIPELPSIYQLDQHFVKFRVPDTAYVSFSSLYDPATCVKCKSNLPFIVAPRYVSAVPEYESTEQSSPIAPLSFPVAV